MADLVKTETVENKPYRACVDADNQTHQLHGRPTNFPVVSFEDASDDLNAKGKAYWEALTAFHEVVSNDETVTVKEITDEKFVTKVVAEVTK